MTLRGISSENIAGDRINSYIAASGTMEDGMPSFQDSLKAATDTEAKIRSKEVPVSDRRVPYSQLAKNGLIDYKGVVFVCDYEKNTLCLGDMTNPGQVLSIPLSGGGVLKVNRDNIDDLAKAIGMFSPEDVNLIMRALARDAQCSRKLNEIENMKSKIKEEN